MAPRSFLVTALLLVPACALDPVPRGTGLVSSPERTRSASEVGFPYDLVVPADSDLLQQIEAALDFRLREDFDRVLDARESGELLEHATLTQLAIDRGIFGSDALFVFGDELFEYEFRPGQGLGNNLRHRPGIPAGSRGPPNLRRVHEGEFGGPDSHNCATCHFKGGPDGAGTNTQNAFLRGDGNRTLSADERNPPHLLGLGPIQALAREVEGKLISKGVAFGVLRVAADGTVDTTGVEGVDPDLVIRPFGWKGTFATLRDFVKESLQVHLGIQSEGLVQDHKRHPDPELVGSGADPDDPDGDGVRGELTAGQLTALISFLAMQEMPVVRPPETLHDFAPVAKNVLAPTATVFLDDWTRGKQLFDELECSTCHVPRMVLKDPVFRTRSATTGEVLQIDLSRVGERPRLQYDPRLKGYPVWLFSDLKRHDLGESSASRHVDHGVPCQVYQTRRLWGLANSPPYFYDGHAPWFDQAISAHGAEAETSATAYSALTYEDKGALRVYLLSLRRERRLIVP